MAALPQASAEFRFYEELNDFLPPDLRRRAFVHRFLGTPSVKDTIEAIGVPHTEIDLILVDGESVDFARKLRGGERVAVYPMFERLDISIATRLRPRPLRDPRFVLDVHLGKLARYLRLVGFDAIYRNDYDDHAIIALSLAERRTILTRDKGLLKHNAVTHAHWLRCTEPGEQLREVVRVFDLSGLLRPFTRCMVCNGELREVAKEEVAEALPPRVREYHDRFARCMACGKVYWPGTHYARMGGLIEALRAEQAPG